MFSNVARRLLSYVSGGLLCLGLATTMIPTEADAAQGCRRASVSGASKTIDPGRINQRLLNAALVAEINYLRCRRNLPQLSATTGLHKAAVSHSRWMAKSRRLTHNSSIRGKQTPSQRIRATGGKIRMGSENIAKVSYYRLDEVGRFRIGNGGRCDFSTSSGARITPHSYDSLAKYVANLWYTSSGHRKNLLDGRARMIGTGAGFDARARNCGDIYLTQAFAG